MALQDKILSPEDLHQWREGLRTIGQKLVVTNGCFDILHAGHVTYLDAAKAQGDALLIGLNSDASVKQLKGPSRPINNEQDRATVIAALGCVDAVGIFEDVDAVNFSEGHISGKQRQGSQSCRGNGKTFSNCFIEALIR